MKSAKTVIIGAGLSGLYSAFLLSQRNREFLILEARNRIGGRILGLEHEGLVSDMGPSWFWPDIHPKITGLINGFGLTAYKQYENGLGRIQTHDGQVNTVRGLNNEPVCWRIFGGVDGLLSRLLSSIPAKNIRLDHPVCRIEKTRSGLQVAVGDIEKEPDTFFDAKHVILALPPRLAASTILFTPDLSFELAQEMLKTGTWMAGQAKFCAVYDKPFWRSHGLSGQAFSHCGPIGEIHDGSNHDQPPYGLTGFLGVPAIRRNNKEELNNMMLRQLELIFGEPAAHPAAFFYKDWARERYTATEYDQPSMLEHPAYSPPAGKISIWDNSVRFAGTETADEHGGYMEGAIIAAERATLNI
ncbi:flavin monoamine oxidase family protein [Desulforhopalus sp. 52FAK]